MSAINVLDDITINKIAAGEVIEKPMAVVKELTENSIDAGADSITIEIKNGGLESIRVTDNGSGINKDEIACAFYRHATSKISTINDLDTLHSLGFRGEALASIAAVSMVECITKTKDSITGIRYIINGGKEESIKEVGAPDGTTFVVRNIFYNTPARLKFLKTPVTEGTYINDIVEKLALSHPDIAFRFINNGKLKFQTSGNGKLKDVIYQIYGRDITDNIIPYDASYEGIYISGYIGKPVISRGNRSYMICFVNGRYIKSPVLYKAIEEAYDGFLMGHKYPFCVFNLIIDSSTIDVNVHPSKQEIRFGNSDLIFTLIRRTVRESITNIDIIPANTLIDNNQNKKDNNYSAGIPAVAHNRNTGIPSPEPFEIKRINNISRSLDTLELIKKLDEQSSVTPSYVAEQQTLFGSVRRKNTPDPETKKDISIIGCVFSTYWIIQFHDEMYIMDQHAAHEKVLYERFMQEMNSNELSIQSLSPPIIITLNPIEASIIEQYNKDLINAGFEITPFGGSEYTVNTIPANLPDISAKEAVTDIIASLCDDISDNIKKPVTITDRIAVMSCKAAVKGGRTISFTEAKKLIEDLFKLDNPFNCPHGRPTMIKMTKYELEKRFGRQL